jgi:predicted metalloprotease with PDZ domain
VTYTGGGIFTSAFASYIRNNERRKLTWQELFRGASQLTQDKFARDNPRGIDGSANKIPGIGLQRTQTPSAIVLNITRGGEDTPQPPQRMVFGAAVVNHNGDGVMVQRVVDGTPAQRAGIEPQDVLLKLNGAAIRSTDDYLCAIDDSGVDLQILLRNCRDGQLYWTVVRLNK